MTKSGKNKGEASELYALLSVLRDRGIYAADENLEKDESRFYPVTKIFTNDISENSSHFVIENGESFAVKGSTKIDSISQNNLEKDVEEIYLVLNTNTDKGTLNYDFDILKERYHLDKVSAGSTSKIDINLKIYDEVLKTSQILPFSIKSFIGSKPTLLNSSGMTNFVYEVCGTLTKDDVNEINNMFVETKGKKHIDVIGRTKTILSKGCKLKFKKVQGETFEGNLRVIDSLLPEIISELLIGRSVIDNSNLSQITEYLTKTNPLNFIGNHDFYRTKITHLLIESFMGMVPRQIWNGYEQVHGGYIIVKSSGEVLCYPLSNRNAFEEYLFKNTFLENCSTSRSKYASIEEENGKYIYKLNLAIRFNK